MLVMCGCVFCHALNSEKLLKIVLKLTVLAKKKKNRFKESLQSLSYVYSLGNFQIIILYDTTLKFLVGCAAMGLILTSAARRLPG